MAGISKELHIKMFGKMRLIGDGSGWHVVRRDAEGNWESLSGPHYSYVVASINKKRLENGKEKLHLQ